LLPTHTATKYSAQRVEPGHEATLPDYRENLDRARFNPIPVDFARLRAAIRGDQQATNQCYLAREGMIPSESFFNPEIVRRL
jgi:hypothetical protein